MDFRSSEPLDTANSLNQSANMGAESMAKEVQTQVAHAGQQIGHASLASAPAMPGADALAGGLPVPGAEQGISPLVQMIMKMPGHIGLASSFFEFLGSFFMPQGDLLNGLDLGSIFGGDHMSSLSLGLEHSDIDLSLLPDDAPILSTLGEGAHGLGHNLASLKLNSSLGLGFGDSTMIGNDPLGFDRFNVSGHITGKPLFEGAGGLRMSGPSLSNNIGNHLASNSRSFSDNLLSGGSQSSLGAPSSNLFAQATGNSQSITANSLNVGSSTFNGGNAAASSANASFGSSTMNNSESFQSTIGNMKADSATGSNAGISNENLGGLKAKALSLDGKAPAASEMADAKNLQNPQNLEIKSVDKPQLDKAHVDKPQVDKSHVAKAQPHHVKAHSANTQIAQARPQDVGPNPATDTIGQPEMTDAQAPTDAAQAPAETTYTVKTGDSLWDIAKNHLGDGTKWTEIYKLNQNVLGTNPDMIMPGTNLQLPGGADHIASASGSYTVKAGDNLWDIAKEQLGDGSKWNELYANNHDLIGQNPGVIHPGQELAINNGAAQTQISQAAPDPANMTSTTPAAPTSSVPAVSHAAPPASAPAAPDMQAAAPQHISSNFDNTNNPMVQPGATPLDASQPYGSDARFVSETPANNGGYQLDKPAVKVETAHAKPDQFLQPAQAADGTSKILKDVAGKNGAVKTNLASDIMSVLKKKS